MVAAVQGNEQRESTLLHSNCNGMGWGFNGPGAGRGLGYGGHTTRLVCPTNSTLYQLPLCFWFSRDQGGRKKLQALPFLLQPHPLLPSCHSPTITGLPFLARQKREKCEQVAVACSSLATLFGCRTSAPVARHKHISSIQHVKQASLHGLPLPPPQKNTPPPSTNSQTHFFSQLQPSIPTPFTLQYTLHLASRLPAA